MATSSFQQGNNAASLDNGQQGNQTWVIIVGVGGFKIHKQDERPWVLSMAIKHLGKKIKRKEKQSGVKLLQMGIS